MEGSYFVGDQADFVGSWSHVTGPFAADVILDHIDCDADPSMQALDGVAHPSSGYVVAEIAQGVLAIHGDPSTSTLTVSVGAASWTWDHDAPDLGAMPADVMTGELEPCEVWLDPAPGIGG